MIRKLPNAASGKTAVIAGLGGLGGYGAAQLARFNFSKLILMDGDSFEQSNMDRQLFCTKDTIGINKAEATAIRLREFSSCNIEPIAENLTASNSSILEGADILLDCTDSVQSKLELERVATLYGIPLVHAAIGSFFGQCAIVFPGDNILSKIYSTPQVYPLQTLSFVPCRLASIQVAETLKVLAGISTLKGKLLILDTLTNDLRMLDIHI